MSRTSTIYALLVVTTVVWGGAFVAIKQALNYLSPLELLFMRFVPASLAFGLLILVRLRHEVTGLLRREWRSLAAMGFFGVLVYHLALNTGEQLIPAGTASLIMAAEPAFVFLLSLLLLGERLTLTRALGLATAFAGLFVVIRFASSERIDFRYLQGVLITLLAPISWAAYTIISRPLATRYAPIAVTGMATIFAGVPILFTGSAGLLGKLPSMPWDGWLSIAYLAFLATVGGVTVWVLALQRLEASQVGVFIYLVPLWSAVLSKVVLGEPITASLVLGATLVIGGVVLVNR
jgi:drug/metabolite transporter (DMT)-like permease